MFLFFILHGWIPSGQTSYVSHNVSTNVNFSGKERPYFLSINISLHSQNNENINSTRNFHVESKLQDIVTMTKEIYWLISQFVMRLERECM